ncbi:MAG: F0F1 ATP synthase subunit alpha [Ruminococcus sp.]|nr:F0F1 ATP synthase subunit alpha [Ruminococcus sp.]
MSTMSASEIISVLKSEIEDFDRKSGVQETGTVVLVGDGIATVYGIQHAMYGELVEFENGVRGIVQNLETKTISVVLLGSDYGIIEGTKVVRTKKRAGIGISPKMVGRVVDALGSPIDGGGSIEAEDFFPIEREAPGMANRKSVSVPLQTGILSIDSMFPIGRGQRELIIGDRQTGKTSIAVDTIINQKGQDVICIYVAIGQKSSTVAKIVSTLKKMDAMDYTIVVSASASEPAPVQYISPYSGTAIAEYFMMQGKDVLIVYDDLSKHAVAYRAISLLLHRPPGREAYPGDVFYLHSRLLERSCRLDDAHGGGSITALPIIETQVGDVSAYIPTNVISITDGQIFLESELFNAGMRPAVNVGLSVSRVGSAAQTKAMKKASGQMRIELAQFREMEVFTQFSSDLDPATQAILDHGHILMELLKQPLYHPLAMWKEVVLLVAASKKLMDDVEPSELNDFRAQMLHYVSQNGADLVQEIQKTGMMSDETMEALIALIIKYKKQVN